MRPLWRWAIAALAVTGCAQGAVTPVAQTPQAIGPGLDLYKAHLSLGLTVERRVQALPAPAAWDTVVVTVNSPRLKGPLTAPIVTGAATLSIGFNVPVGSASIEAALFHGGATGSLVASGSTVLALVAGPNVASLSVQPTGVTLGTLAGGGGSGASANGIPAQDSLLNRPMDVVTDTAGNVLFAEESNHRVRMIPKVAGTYFGIPMTSGRVYTVAGTGGAGLGGDNLLATSADLNRPCGIALDASGNLYIADTYNHKIRRVNPSGVITTAVGNGVPGGAGDGINAPDAQLKSPEGVAVDGAGNLYIADTGNHQIVMVPAAAGNYFGKTMAANAYYAIAGTFGVSGFAGDGNMAGTGTQFNSPAALRFTPQGDLIIADTMNHRIRLIPTVSGHRFGMTRAMNIVNTLAGNGSPGSYGEGIMATTAQVCAPVGLAINSSGNLFFADTQNHRIRQVDYNGMISTVAGVGASGFENGLAMLNGKFSAPRGLAFGGADELVVADTNNHQLRIVRNWAGGN